MKRFWSQVALMLVLCFPQTNVAAEQTNFLVILADDLGYGDLGCYGNADVHTPHLDRFAGESLRLTDCYASHPNCSPSRTGLMTGRTPWRVGIHNWIPFMSPMHVRDSEITIATLLRNAGYDTGHFGKWHLNGMFNLPGQPQPSDHGFNHWFSTQNNALPNHHDPYNFVRNGIPVGPQQGYSAELVADETIRWLSVLRNKEKPFFAYVCFHEPHEPIATAPQHEAHYAHNPDPSYRAHHGNITQLDAGVGKVLYVLDQLGLRDSTFVFFTSDNGPAMTNIHPHGSSGPLREHKGYVYEGGIRVPGMIRWPGHTQAGSVSSQPVIGTDLLPTLCQIAGISPPTDRKLDGASLMPLFDNRPVERTTPLYWHFLRAQGEIKVALREGDWKLCARVDQPIPSGGADITAEDIRLYKRAELTGFELYNLKDDVGETRDLTESEPERFSLLREQLLVKYHEVREESPTWPQWTWPRYESQRIEWPPYRGRPARRR